MFVQNIKGLDAANRLKKAKKKAVGSDFSVFLEDEGEEQKQINEVYAAPNINPMIFLQDVGSQQNVVRNNYERGKELLDGLENYRRAILTGKDSEDLQKIANELKSQRTKSNDAALESLIDDIELRAAVEAAKKEIGE